MIKNALNIFFCFFMLVSSSGAVELQTYRGPEITIRYQAPLSGPAERIGSHYKKARTDIETKLGWQLYFDPSVVLIGDSEVFQEMVRNKLVTAFAVPEKNLIVIDYSRMDRIPFDLEDTLKHELSHLLLHQQIAPPLLPKWLDEGVSQWASGGIADILHTGEKDILRQAVLSSRLIPLTGISMIFPDTDWGLMLAYEESKSIVEFILHRYGEENLRLILHGLENQRTIDQALYAVLGTRLDTLEQTWKKGLSRESSWISYVADHMSWVLFFLAALITVAGFCVVKRRIKNYRDEEDGEGAEESGGQQTEE